MKTFFGILIFLTFPNFLLGQSNIFVKILTLSTNFERGENDSLYKNKISKNGFLTLEPALLVGIETFADSKTSIKFHQSLGFDAVSHLCGFTQIMIRRQIWEYYRNKIFAGIGPTLFLRESWSNIPEYKQDNSFEKQEKIEYSISWFSGEIEYNRKFSKRNDLTISLNHNHPWSFCVAVGWKFWFTRETKKPCNCPTY